MSRSTWSPGRRVAPLVEDWHGNYWRSERSPVGPFHDKVRRCADPECVVEVEVVRDVVGRWYARHQTFIPPGWPVSPRGAPSVTSQRFEHWQEAAEWAFAHGLTTEGHDG